MTGSITSVIMAELGVGMSKADEKVIRISCEGAGTIPLDELVPLQGKLKILSEEAYQRLRMSIIELGFSFPVVAWKDKTKKNWIIDAHQRVYTVKRMRDEEGYTVPDLPAVWVNASSKKEAAAKCLAAASQYGEVTYEGLNDFMTTFQMHLAKITTEFQFPEIDFKRFEQAYYPEKTEVSFTAKPGGSKEIPEEEFSEFDHECPKCGFEWDEK